MAKSKSKKQSSKKNKLRSKETLQPGSRGVN